MKPSPKTKSLLWLILIAATAVLTWTGLAQHYPETNTLRYLPDRLFRLVKTLTGADPLGSAVEPAAIPASLILAKLLVTLLLIGALYKIIEKVFHEQYTRLRVALKRRHTVIIGAGGKGRALLQSCLSQTGQSAVVIEQRADCENLAAIREHGHLTLIGNATARDTLLDAGVQRAATLICLTDNENTGIEIAARLTALYAERQPANRLDCHLHLDNPRLVDIFRRNSLGSRNHGINIRFFNWRNIIARRFFQHLPRTLTAALRTPGIRISVHLIGYGDTAAALLLQGLRVFHLLPGQHAAWHIHTANAARHARDFAAQYPQAHRIAPVTFHEHDSPIPPDLPADPDGQQTLVICAAPDSQRNLETAAELLNAHPHAAYPIHIHGNSKRLAALLDGKARHRLHFFGDDGETCDHELITGNRQDRLARAIHADYLIQSGKLPAHTPSESSAYQTAWDELNEDAQVANRAQADHIPYKLALTGKTAAQPLHFSAEETEALAQSEHRRWAAHRYLNGWQYGATRDDGGKRHPSLIDWEQLDEAEKQKDRDTVNRIAALLAQTGTQDL